MLLLMEREEGEREDEMIGRVAERAPAACREQEEQENVMIIASLSSAY